MFRLLSGFISLIIFYTANAQTKALTENGREVLLFDNGTWNYTQDGNERPVNDKDTLSLNSVKFSKPNGETFLVKSNNINVGIFINPQKWTFSPHRDNEVIPEYIFHLKSGEGMAMLITEKTQIGLENMRQIALINAQKAAVDAKIASAEYRIVNNKKVLCLVIKGTIQGIKFQYLGYYYSNENGTMQLLTYSSQKMFPELRKDLEDFLNGFVETDPK